MKTKVALVAATWLSLASSDPITSKLRVHIPRSLSQDEGYKHTDARFGLPPFGGSISQNVFYADSTLCSPTLQRGQGYPKRGKGGYPEPPFIMMVDRGDCTFVTQVRNAQKNGAAAVLVADTMCVCGVGTSCVKTHSTDNCQRELPTMGDDGSGSDISIPSFLVYKNGADLIKGFLRTNQTVQVEMSWRVPKDDYVVTYELWTSPTDELSRHFIRTFKDVSIRLRERTEFSPHMYLTSFKEVVDDDSGFFDKSCTNHRRYCYATTYNGSFVVRESLRRLCIWEMYGEDYDERFAGVDGKWWEYSAHYSDLCSNMSVGSQSDCAEDVMARVGIDPNMINDCMTNSGGTESDQANEILEDELLLRDERGINSVPTLIVNGYTVRSAITSTNVFDVICSGFHAEETPDICRGCVGCADVRRCVNNDGICHGDLVLVEPGASKVSSVTFVLSLMFVTTTLAGLGFWYFKRYRAEMRNQVRLILADYVPLEDEDKGGATTTETRSGSIPCARDGDTAEEESPNPS